MESKTAIFKGVKEYMGGLTVGPIHHTHELPDNVDKVEVFDKALLSIGELYLNTHEHVVDGVRYRHLSEIHITAHNYNQAIYIKGLLECLGDRGTNIYLLNSDDAYFMLKNNLVKLDEYAHLEFFTLREGGRFGNSQVVHFGDYQYHDIPKLDLPEGVKICGVSGVGRSLAEGVFYVVSEICQNGETRLNILVDNEKLIGTIVVSSIKNNEEDYSIVSDLDVADLLFEREMFTPELLLKAVQSVIGGDIYIKTSTVNKYSLYDCVLEPKVTLEDIVINKFKVPPNKN